MIGNNIAKVHLEKAIAEIKSNGVPKGRQSFKYDLVFEGEYYPPLLVVSYANRIVNGEEFAPNTLGGGPNSDAFKLLKRNGFEIVEKVKNKKLYDLKNKFLKEWPIERLETMSLNEYTNLEKTSFCYWLEHITRDIGSIVGGSSYKFGIYERIGNSEVKEESNRMTDGNYAWFKKYGSSRNEAFESVRIILIQIANGAKNNELSNIENIDLGFAYKWKIAFLYGDYNVVNIFKEKTIRKIAEKLEIEEDQIAIGQLHSEIMNKKPIDEDYYDFTRKYWRLLNEADLIDVKDDFAEWLNVNTFDSYRSYLGSSIQEITIRLDEIDDFFPGIDLFKVDESQVEKLKREISKRLNKKERVKNPEFVEYDLKHSNGIPKAVIGKNNYFRFLDQRDSAKVSIDKPSDEERLIDRLVKIGKKDSGAFYYKMEAFVNSLELSPNNKSVCYNLPNNELIGITIGQKYALTISRKNKKNTINYMDTTSDENNWYKEAQNFDVLNEVEGVYTLSAKKELLKTFKSGFENKNSLALEKSIFDENYRKHIFDLAFKNGQIRNEMNEPINTILYGPPGTGKTYRLKNEYFSKYTSKETSLTKEKHFENVVKECSWWHVIAISLLEMGKSKVADIYKNKWVQQKAKLSSSKTVRPTIWGTLQARSIEDSKFVNVKNRLSPQIFDKDENSFWKIINSEVQEQSPELFEIINSVENFTPNADKEIKRYKFVTFHQSFSYEDFIEGIKPVLPEGEEVSGDLGYKIENGVFKDLCIDAKNDPENKYAIFIDEINRGNVSAIFGELITLIETDKRTGCDNEVKVVLPYSKEEFSVPSNLDIYGTMNTADRSVEALDTALRRRFSFIEMMPDYEVISKLAIDGINLKEVLKTINDRVELLVDRDHTIGHSYFIDIDTKEKLCEAFNDKITPLLQEYFYGDYGKIGLVLGEGFVKKAETKDITFANFKYDDSDDFKTPKFNLIKMNEGNIITAIKTLLRKVEESSEE